MAKPGRIGLYYDAGAYREQLQVGSARAGSPQGLMGRQVAGKEFLDAYLQFGDWNELLAVTPNDASAQVLLETCRSHPSSRNRQRKLSHVTTDRFHEGFLADPPVSLLHFPTPPDPKFAWARRAGARHRFAFCGVTHTLCSLRAVEVLRGLVTDPWEPYDRLICTSRAVTNMVRQVIDSYGGYLQETHELPQRPIPKIELETIPLGVDIEKFRPATPEERRQQRQRLGIADEELMVLFVGRLSHHAKAHPFPMNRGISEAARRSGKKVRLCLMGWAGNQRVQSAFLSAAKEFGPHLQTEILDGLDQENRFGAWKAADVFCSLSDNIQETFGLVIIEAMASGLPVVATDWNGYRDLVVDGETGFLIRTQMIRGASENLTSRLLLGELNYNHFLAQSSQCVAVDTAGVANAFVRLLENAELRSQLGGAGRKRVETHFAWPTIIKQYKDLWGRQQQLLEGAAGSQTLQPGTRHEAYPPLQTTFAGYPSAWLEDDALLQSCADWENRLAGLMNHPLTNYAPNDRLMKQESLITVLEQAHSRRCELRQLLDLLQGSGHSEQSSRASVAWLLKYDLIRRSADHAEET